MKMETEAQNADYPAMMKDLETQELEV